MKKKDLRHLTMNRLTQNILHIGYQKKFCADGTGQMMLVLLISDLYATSFCRNLNRGMSSSTYTNIIFHSSLSSDVGLKTL